MLNPDHELYKEKMRKLAN
jgi:hypothetical protein